MRKSPKDHFVGVRVEHSIIDWVREYADGSDLTLSDVFRQALIEFKGRVEALQHAKEEKDLEMLREHLGDMYRFRNTEEGLLLERIKPQVITLGTERRVRNGQSRGTRKVDTGVTAK